jgi:hypothetical protein
MGAARHGGPAGEHRLPDARHGGRFDGLAPPANSEFLADAIPGARRCPPSSSSSATERPARLARRLPTMDVTTTPEWKALAAHFDEI